MFKKFACLLVLILVPASLFADESGLAPVDKKSAMLCWTLLAKRFTRWLFPGSVAFHLFFSAETQSSRGKTHLQCDLVGMNLGKRFDLIIAPFRVFSHIIDIDD